MLAFVDSRDAWDRAFLGGVAGADRRGFPLKINKVLLDEPPLASSERRLARDGLRKPVRAGATRGLRDLRHAASLRVQCVTASRGTHSRGGIWMLAKAGKGNCPFDQS